MYFACDTSDKQRIFRRVSLCNSSNVHSFFFLVFYYVCDVTCGDMRRKVVAKQVVLSVVTLYTRDVENIFLWSC